MKKVVVLLTLLMILMAPTLVLAVACTSNAQCTATPATPVCSNGTCVSGGQWFQNIITNLLNVVVWPVFITVSIIMFIWAGILFLTAHGDPGKIHQATLAVVWATIGIAVGILGYVAVGIIRGLLGL